ncbi:MAG TPA: acetate kinase [Planctomycetota bacterium]|nr:acetate kinase [Planctomycetota bacterium]
MPDKVLVLNCGSSSIKYQLYLMPEGAVLAKGLVEKIGEACAAYKHTDDGGEQAGKQPIADHREGLAVAVKCLTGSKKPAIKAMNEIKAVGHRVVHGGEKFTGSVLVTPEVEKTIEEYYDLAPLHNPPNMTGIRAAQQMLPGVPQIACFDTSFHTTLPEVAYVYALPYEIYEKYRVRRYGFHGTSHRYVARRAAELLGKHKYDFNAVTCHLGNGCSMAAVAAGRSVDTTMGLTPLEGLVMGTRSGDIDPAIIFYLAGKPEYKSVKDIDTMMNKKSGLLGVSGVSNDMRAVRQAAAEGNKRAGLALDIFCYRIRKYIGAYAAVLPRLDAVIFTGGIGENAAPVRAKIIEGLGANLGITLDAAKNDAAVFGKEGDVAAADSRVHVMVVPTNEEKAIAVDTYALSRNKSVSQRM